MNTNEHQWTPMNTNEIQWNPWNPWNLMKSMKSDERKMKSTMKSSQYIPLGFKWNFSFKFNYNLLFESLKIF